MLYRCMKCINYLKQAGIPKNVITNNPYTNSITDVHLKSQISY